MIIKFYHEDRKKWVYLRKCSLLVAVTLLWHVALVSLVRLHITTSLLCKIFMVEYFLFFQLSSSLFKTLADNNPSHEQTVKRHADWITVNFHPLQINYCMIQSVSKKNFFQKVKNRELNPLSKMTSKESKTGNSLIINFSTFHNFDLKLFYVFRSFEISKKTPNFDTASAGK